MEHSDDQSVEFDQYGDRPLSDYSESVALQQNAVKEIPEAVSSNHRGASNYAPYPLIYMEEADGSTLTDVDGNRYIDFHGGVSSIIVGHSPSEQIEAVKQQLDSGAYFATTYETEYEAAKLVNDLVPSADLTKFTSTGTEAIMSAFKLARAYTGKDKILKFEGMYHGHTDYALVNVHPDPGSLGTECNPTKIPGANGVPEKVLETVESVPWNSIELLEERLERDGDEIAAVITEAVMSNSGLLWPREGYLEELRRLTREHDVLFILDEVVTGFRMGLHGAQGFFDIDPDLTILGKAMANGYPCAALAGRREVMEFISGEPSKATFMGTFSGNPLVVAAAKANLEQLKDIGESGYEELREKGERLTDGLQEIITDAGHDVFIPDNAGFFCVHFVDDQSSPETWTNWRDIGNNTDPERYNQFASAMIGEGIFITPKGDRINLMHSHTDAHINEALEAAKSAIELVD